MTLFAYFRWWLRSFRREYRKGKFYAICRFFWDSKYRADVLYMARLTTKYPLKSVEATMALGLIHPSHDVNYPKWVDSLQADLMRFDSVDNVMAPLVVMYDPLENRWLVVDGNHRLRALQRVYPRGYGVPVLILYPSHLTQDELDFMMDMQLLSRYHVQEVK